MAKRNIKNLFEASLHKLDMHIKCVYSHLFSQKNEFHINQKPCNESKFYKILFINTNTIIEIFDFFTQKKRSTIFENFHK